VSVASAHDLITGRIVTADRGMVVLKPYETLWLQVMEDL